MSYSLTYVWIGLRKVGLIGLEQIFAEVYPLGLDDNQALTAEIIKRLRRSNYIPVEAIAASLVETGRREICPRGTTRSRC